MADLDTLDAMVHGTILGEQMQRVRDAEADARTRLKAVARVLPRTGELFQSRVVASGRYVSGVAGGTVFDAFLIVPEEGEENYAQLWFGRHPVPAEVSELEGAHWRSLPESLQELMTVTYSALILGDFTGGFVPPTLSLQQFFQSDPDWWSDGFPQTEHLYILQRGPGGRAPYLCVDSVTGAGYCLDSDDLEIQPVADLVGAIDDYIAEVIEVYEI